MSMEQVLRLFLLKIQSTEGTAETDLDGSNFIEVEDSSRLEPDVVPTEINLVGGGYEQDAAVIGRRKANVTLSWPLRKWGAQDSGITPDWVNAWTAARFSHTQNNGYHILKPSNTVYTDCTVWRYSGDLNASKSLLAKAFNVKFDWKLSFDFSGDTIARLELTGVGAYDGAPANATQPTVSKNRSAVPGLTGVTMSINGDSDYVCTSLEITGNQSVDPTTMPSATGGVGVASVTSRKIKFSAKCYMDVTGTVDPEAALFALTEGAVAVSWGVGTEISVSCAYAQITKVVPSDENGV